METKKQEAIRNKWGTLFEKAEDYLNDDGYADYESKDMQSLFWANGDYDYFQITDRL